jgi:hypothetical protein
MVPNKLCQACLSLLVLACGGQEPARSAERASVPATSTTLSNPGRSSATDTAGVSTEGPRTELTPASGSRIVSPPNSLALTSGANESDAATGAPKPISEPTGKPDVIYVPTPQPVVDRMLEMAQVTKNDVVYDLGCGDGRIVVTAAKRYGARAFGFDIDPARVAEANANVKAAKVEHLVTIEQKDIFTLDLSPASVVTLYLLPQLNVRLIPQLEKLKPGSRVVSHDFPMEGVKPLRHVTLKPEGEAEHAIFFWKTPFVRE